MMDSKSQRAAFEKLVHQYSEQLYWMIRRMVMSHEDANDLLQNTFMKAWNAFDTFHGDAKESTWLSRIAINECLDFIRRNKKRPVATSDEMSVARTLMADPYFDGSEAEALLQEAMDSLPEVQRMVFQLRYFDDMKYADISRLLDTSEGALKASYHIAVKKIASFLKAHD